MNYRLLVNGQQRTVDAAPTARLSDVLREELGLTGTKIGCNAGDCGACTILINGDVACGCLTPLAQVDGAKIETIEGLSTNGTMSPLQQSFLHYGAAQCGICTPGMLTAAKALLDKNPRPDHAAVENALAGVLCRCTGYRKILDAVINAHGFNKTGEKPDAGKSIGSPIRHLDGDAKVTGTLAYGADAIPENAVAVRIIRSPYHKAKFEFGDFPEFLRNNVGVELVLTARDVPGKNCFGVIPQAADQPVFAVEIARYRGEAVAAIVGQPDVVTSFEEKDFPITWSELDHVLDPNDALKTAQDPIHQGRDSNVLIKGFVERGDATAALKNAAHKVTVTTTTPFIEHAYIEPEAGYCKLVAGRLEVFGSTQAAQMDRDSLAEIMAMNVNQIRIRPSACGGGFGSKLDISYQPYIAMAAHKLGKPAYVCYSRGDSMRSTTKRHPSEITLRVGCTADGLISGFDFDGIFNTGAYASWGPTVANRVPVHASGPYFTPDFRCESVAVHTNTPPSGAFRGFGVPQSAIAQETAYDELATLAGIDRLEFRLKNALRNNQPTATGQVFGSGVGIVECFKALKPAWQEATRSVLEFNSAHSTSGLRKGVGIAGCWYGCGNTSLPNPSTVRMGISPDGQVVLHQGAMDIGQGANTVISQIAADAFGCRVHAIAYIDGDTDLTPDCGKTSASRQTYVTGSAAKLAGEALRKEVLRVGNVGDSARIELEDGVLRLHGSSDTISIQLSSFDVNEFGYVFMAQETYDPPTTKLDEKGQGVPYAVYGYGAQIAELTVDTAFGTVKLDQITAAHDVGRAINPLLVEGQIEGGIAQGIGMALMEEYIPGRTENLHDYLIPTIGDVPPVKSIIVEVPDPEGPYGAKGLGEHVLIPTAPAILNAIRDATGATVRNLPATPDKVLAATKEANCND
jgi:aldehyde oxidoreductase